MISKETIPSKKCNCCHLFLELNNFNNTKDGCRYGKVSVCKSCRRIKNKTRYLKIRETMLRTKAVQYQQNSEIILSRSRSYRERNPDKVRQTRRDWNHNNSDRRRAQVAYRRAQKKKATPSWLTLADKERIIVYYTLASKLAIINGREYHVDHIVPLQGKGVCGLHVPWNLQVIPAEENLAKYNKTD